MADDDPAATLRLLWRHASPAAAETRRGPKQRLGVDDVVDTAIRVADSSGLAALSMRSLARELGIGAMSLYTYVSGREQLLELMVDQAVGRTPLPAHDAGLRPRLAVVARATYEEHLRHPWLAEAIGARPNLGPHSTARYEWQLEALEGLGLDDVEMDQAVALLAGFAADAARLRTQAARAAEQADTAWWRTVAPTLEELVPADRFPLGSRVGAAAGEAYGGASEPTRQFEFGLERVVDGLVALVEARARSL